MKEANRVLRFTLGERLAHWSHTVAFVTLLLTGLLLVFRNAGHLLGPPGLRLAGQLHHWTAWPFTFLTPAILVLAAPKQTGEWLRSIATWTKDDLAFLAAFPREFFGLKAELPKQGKFNAGEKVNSLLTLFGSLLLIATGWIMLYRDHFSKATLAWVYPLHDLGALLLGSVIIGHAYLALLHPNSRESIRGMVGGTVSRRFAREHHALWYERLNSR